MSIDLNLLHPQLQKLVPLFLYGETKRPSVKSNEDVTG